MLQDLINRRVARIAYSLLISTETEVFVTKDIEMAQWLDEKFPEEYYKARLNLFALNEKHYSLVHNIDVKDNVKTPIWS